MSSQGRLALLVVGVIMVVMVLMFGVFAATMMGPFGSGMGVTLPGFILIFGVVIVVIIVGIVMAVASRRGSNVQRPSTQQTAYPPPRPPDSVLVKCPYCGASQPFAHACVNCGAPLPKPEFNQT